MDSEGFQSPANNYPQQPFNQQDLQQPQYYNQPTGAYQPSNKSNDEQTWQSQPLPPYTQYPQQSDVPPPPPPKKRRGPLFWALIIVGALVLFIIFANAVASVSSIPITQATPTATPDIAATNVANSQATQDAATPVVDTTTTPLPTPNPAQSDTYANGDYKVGKTAQVGLMTMTLNSVKTSYGGSYDSLKAGNIFLIIDVTVYNGSGNPQIVSSGANFKLNDSTGQGYNETIIEGAKPPDDTALRDGAKLRGQLVYEVPKTMKNFTLTYQSELESTDQATWDISL